MNANQVQAIAAFQPALTEQDRSLRDEFVVQYFLDFNPINAVIRLGYNPGYAEHMSQQFMLDTYVLKKIEQNKRSPEGDKEQLKRWVSAELMSRACFNGPGSSETAKIQALRVLIELHGLVPGKNERVNNLTIDGQCEDVTEMSEEEVMKELSKRGLPTNVFSNEQEEFLKKKFENGDAEKV